MTAGDVCRRNVLTVIGKHKEARALALRTHFAVAVCLELVLYEPLDFRHERLRRLQLGTVHNLPRALRGQQIIIGFKRDEASATIYLFCEPICAATQINAFDSSFEHSGMVISRS